MSELRTFVEARLSEDELWALAASAPPNYCDENAKTPPDGVHWTWGVGENWEPYRPNPLEEFIGEGAHDTAPTLITVEKWRAYPGSSLLNHSVLSVDDEVRTADGAHIVRHDPARVLREVAAKRRLVAEHSPHAMEPPWGGPIPCQGCHANFQEEYATEDIERCPTLLALASVWADHPEYRPEWQVS